MTSASYLKLTLEELREPLSLAMNHLPIYLFFWCAWLRGACICGLKASADDKPLEGPKGCITSVNYLQEILQRNDPEKTLEAPCGKYSWRTDVDFSWAGLSAIHKFNSW